MESVLKISIPVHLSLANYLKFIETINKVRFSNSSIILDFAKNETIGPAGLGMLVALRDACIENGRSLTWRNISSNQLPHLQTSLPLHLPMPHVHNFRDEEKFIIGLTSIDSEIGDKLEQSFSKVLDEEKLFGVQLLLNELMQNAQDHSGSERFYVFAGVHNEGFEFGCFDSGISIPAKLEQKYNYQDDTEAIEKALEKDVTTRRLRPGGLGLWHCFEYLKNMNGNLVVLSRNSSIRRYFRNKKIIRKELRYPLRGSWISLYFERKDR